MKLRPASRGQAPVDGSNLHRHARAGEHTRVVRLSMGRNDRRSQVLEFLACGGPLAGIGRKVSV